MCGPMHAIPVHIQALLSRHAGLIRGEALSKGTTPHVHHVLHLTSPSYHLHSTGFVKGRIVIDSYRHSLNIQSYWSPRAPSPVPLGPSCPCLRLARLPARPPAPAGFQRCCDRLPCKSELQYMVI